MSFWSVASPLATIGASAFGGPVAGALVGGLTGAMAGREKHQNEMATQKRTANAAADAQAVSWATKDGKGFVPQVQWASGTEGGNMLGGGVSQAMTGATMFGGKPATGEGIDWQDLFGSKQASTMGAARQGGNFAMPMR